MYEERVSENMLVQSIHDHADSIRECVHDIPGSFQIIV